ncbi:SCO family protein [Paraferrimonas sp. SM1919]|uniref:SCO family protein n=1 Tax=Paraferrimonas sp. SM1919 TaxID=2662263 RepID=UPI0013D0DBD8|nr:SCO family protein [Paraferrimonas sp. SM1919]
MSKRVVVAVALFVSAMLGGYAHYLSNAKLPLNSALLYPVARPLTDFKLIDHNGQHFTNAQLLNTWSLIFVGYTSCPDICPLTMAKLSAISNKLDQQVQVVFVAVDPTRDSPQAVKEYIEFFNPNFVGVTGEHKDLYPFTRQLGLVYSVGDNSQQNYLVEHSGSLALIDPFGRLAAIIKPSQLQSGQLPQLKVDYAASDINNILAGKAMNL